MYLYMYINLDAAYLEFLTTNYSCYRERIVAVPVSFNYNIPVKDEATKETKVIHGIVEEEGMGEREKSKKQKEWCKAARGLRAEEKIFDKLREQFSEQPCLLLNGFKEQSMLKVIKEKNRKRNKNERMKLINEQVSGNHEKLFRRSEYDVLFFQKVREEKSETVFI